VNRQYPDHQRDPSCGASSGLSCLRRAWRSDAHCVRQLRGCVGTRE
jgi:hypothetical protein